MVTSSGYAVGSAPSIDERFLELICTDDALVQAEFEAIVAFEWRELPPVRRAATKADDDPGVDSAHLGAAGRARRRGRGRIGAGSDLVFARSPPRHRDLPHGVP